VNSQKTTDVLRRSVPGRPIFFAVILAGLGTGFVIAGGELILLGGSSYYLLAGLGLVATGVLAWRRKQTAAWLYAVVVTGTLVWAVFESGFDPWALLPRIVAPALLGLWFVAPVARRRLNTSMYAAIALTVLVILSGALLVGSYLAVAFHPVNPIQPTSYENADYDLAATSWTHFGGNSSGHRFVNASQINTENVAQLELAWLYRASEKLIDGEVNSASTTIETVPIKVGDSLYFCTSTNVVISIDADSGKENWRYDPHVNIDAVPHLACRGVAYHRNKSVGESEQCSGRLLMATVDDRFLAIDVNTGRPCTGFGTDGFVNLRNGLGPALPGYHYVTSPPTIVADVAIVGSFVFDNQSNDEPPGVVRGYDVKTGELLWAWDLLTDTAHPPLNSDDSFPRNTPNVWSIGSADHDLGLVYLPTGNTPPDFFGGHRTPAQDRYSSSIVALEADTGNVRWSFQTVHHDIWDYDIAAQPVLVDWQTPRGIRPAIIATTKRGEVFVLDRRTGEPITPVEEKPVPQGPADGEWLSPTQPYSVGFPSFLPADLTEAAMWGATPIDQLWCRLQFKRSRYEGQFTPQSLQGTITYPGAFGIFNWGSVSIEPERQLMIVNTSHMPWFQKLIERHEADSLGIVPYGTINSERAASHGGPEIYYAQSGTPYAIDSRPFLSPLGNPCHQPPWGLLAVVDLTTLKVMWKRPLGTTRDVAPLGLPLPTGVFNIGGTVSTAGGLTFIGATIDNYLRAFAIDTGRELWKSRLPAGGQSNPISYVSARSGRQFVVIAAGGHVPMQTKPGDYIVAYALPN